MKKDFVIEMFRRIDARNWEELRDFFCDDIVYERPGYKPIVGIEQLLHFYREVRVLACGEHRLANIVVDDQCGASWGSFVGQHRNGNDVDERFADCYTFENGKIKTRISYFFRPAV